MKKILDNLIEYKNIFTAIYSTLFSVLLSVSNSSKIFLNSLDKQRRKGFIFLGVFLSFYGSTVFLLSNFSDKIKIVPTGIQFIAMSLIILFLLIFFCRKSDRCVIKTGQIQPIRKETIIIFSSACFLILLLSLLVNFPGAKSPDTEYQWRQVQTFSFNDWHPVIHTLFIWLVSRVINHYAFVIFAQIAVFSFGVGYLVATLEKWGFSKKIILATGCFIIFNPYTQNIMMYAWKDVAFTICITYLSIMMINTYLSGGEWLKKAVNVVFFALLLGITSKIRHNGIFFTIPLACLIPICYFPEYKKSILCFILAICVVFVIRFPFYTALKVEFPHNGVIESVGIPMTIMGDVMVKAPQSLPSDVKAFLNKIASDDEWHQKYCTGDYNSIKFHSNSSGVVASIPFKDFANMTIKTIKSKPGLALVAVRDLTRIVWGLDGKLDMIGVPVGTTAETNLLKKILNKGLRSYNTMVLTILPLAYLWTKIGWNMLLLLLFGLMAFSKNGKTALFLVVPSVAYNLGTMLLLSGDDIRFFHFNVVITVPLILVLLSKKEAVTVIKAGSAASDGDKITDNSSIWSVNTEEEYQKERG